MMPIDFCVSIRCKIIDAGCIEIIESMACPKGIIIICRWRVVLVIHLPALNALVLLPRLACKLHHKHSHCFCPFLCRQKNLGFVRGNCFECMLWCLLDHRCNENPVWVPFLLQFLDEWGEMFSHRNDSYFWRLQWNLFHTQLMYADLWHHSQCLW